MDMILEIENFKIYLTTKELNANNSVFNYRHLVILRAVVGIFF